MKLDADLTNKLTDAIADVVKKYPNNEQPPTRDAIWTLVVSFLTWEATAQQAEDALERLMGEFVDINELRVSYDFELIELIGEDYPYVEERVERMKASLNEVFNREHAVAMTSVASKGKKEQKQYVETLPGCPAYVASEVMLLAYSAHALPIDRRLLALLCGEIGLKPTDITEQEMEAVLLKQVKAADALKTYLALKAWSDEKGQTPEPVAAPEPTVFEPPEPPVKKKKAKAAAKTVTKAASKPKADSKEADEKAEEPTKAATKKTASKKAASKKATTTKATTTKAATKKATTKKAAAKKTASKKAAAKKTDAEEK